MEEPTYRRLAVLIQAIPQIVNSPGIWGIESDSGEEYFQSVFEDECSILADMLKNFRHVRITK